MNAETIGNDARVEIARRIAAAESILLITHDRPDGDALGCMAALARAAGAQGKRATLVCGRPVPRRYAFVVEGLELIEPARIAEVGPGWDVVVIVDTCTLTQLESVASALPAVCDRTVVIDHHRSREDIAPVIWSDPTAAAAGVMVAELLDDLAWPMDRLTARAVLAAICSDTGWLHFANTDSRALAAAQRCLDAGVAADELYAKLFQNDRPQRLALLGRLLGSMRLTCEGRVAVMTASAADFRDTGAERDETENLINEPLRITDVGVSILLVADGDRIRGSLRSKAWPDNGSAPEAVDVAAVAETLGGGGHARAAGFRMSGTLAEVTATAVAAVAKALPPSVDPAR